MKDVPVNVATTAIPIAAARRSNAVVGDFVALTKPRLNFLVVATSAAGQTKSFVERGEDKRLGPIFIR